MKQTTCLQGATARELHSNFTASGAPQLVLPINDDIGPNWEFNAGMGFGLTDSAEPLNFKSIHGRRFGRRPVATGASVG